MLRVQEVMQETVRYCNPDTNAATAAEIMWNNNCGCLPVVKDGKHVIGMVTDRDLFIALGTQNRKPADLPIEEVMSKDLSVCSPEDDIRSALKTMAQRQAHRLPVVDRSGELKGLLSIDDVVPRAKRAGLSSEVIDALAMISPQLSARS